MQEIHFADTTSLKTHISTSWSPWGPSRVVTRADIDKFSQVTNNQQWIHTDEARAKRESPYHGIVAHGLFIFSLVPSLLFDYEYRVTGSRQFIIRGGEKFRFISPVYPDQVVFARHRLIGVTKKTRGTVLTKEVEIWVKNSSSPTVVGIFHLQYF